MFVYLCVSSSRDGATHVNTMGRAGGPERGERRASPRRCSQPRCRAVPKAAGGPGGRGRGRERRCRGTLCVVCAAPWNSFFVSFATWDAGWRPWPDVRGNFRGHVQPT